MKSSKMLTLGVLWLASCVQYCSGEDFYSFSVKNGAGEEVSLGAYRGKVTLVVNVASQCGYTDSTYKALKKLHDILSFGDYFSVLAFPCNQFGEQEPMDMPEILEFVTSEYQVEFPIFSKIEVVGEHSDPAFRNLIENSSVVPDWNFYKYLVDENGQVVGAWGTRTTIEEIFDDIQGAIEKAKKSKSKATPDKSDAKEEQLGKDEL